MEIKYETLRGENYTDYEENGMAKIKLIFSNINNEEITVLEKCLVKYKILSNQKVKIENSDFIHCYIEIDGENKGIFLEKTKKYNEYFKDNYSYENKKSNLNLVISKEGVRVELIFLGE